MRPLTILGLSGSLRRASTNSALLRVAGGLMPDDAVLEIFDLHPIPLYDGDVEAEGMPAAVQDPAADLIAEHRRRDLPDRNAGRHRLALTGSRGRGDVADPVPDGELDQGVQIAGVMEKPVRPLDLNGRRG
ncbi:MAG: hypothetical protein HC882_06380 [Acidobacteria bacterium]|nr:hypothetical protein [Acidobacteriota bacterium]